MTNQTNEKPREFKLRVDRNKWVDVTDTPDSENLVSSEVIKVIEYSAYEELKNFKDEWDEKDGNSPGYNLQKAKTYGEQNQNLLAIIKKQDEALKFYGDWNNYSEILKGPSPAIFLGEKADTAIIETKEALEKIGIKI